MRFSEHDRVRLEGMRMVGTVSNQWTTVQGVSQVGVQWDSGTFAFVSTERLVPADPVAIPGMTEADRAVLSRAYQTAIMAVPNESQNRTENGTDVTDWQARAEQAEAQVDRVRLVLADQTFEESEWGNESVTVDSIRTALDADQ